MGIDTRIQQKTATFCGCFLAGVEGIEPSAYGFGVIASQVVQTIDNSGKNSSYFIEIPL